MLPHASHYILILLYCEYSHLLRILVFETRGAGLHSRKYQYTQYIEQVWMYRIVLKLHLAELRFHHNLTKDSI